MLSTGSVAPPLTISLSLNLALASPSLASLPSVASEGVKSFCIFAHPNFQSSTNTRFVLCVLTLLPQVFGDPLFFSFVPAIALGLSHIYPVSALASLAFSLSLSLSLSLSHHCCRLWFSACFCSGSMTFLIHIQTHMLLLV